MKISVVIPNYNGAKLLQSNLPKIISAVGGAEIIVVDDASTDDSLEILADNFPEIKVIARPENRGFATSVNDGVKNASGDLILLLNSDILPRPDFLKYLLPHFSNPKVFGVGCLQKSDDGQGKTLHGRGVAKFTNGFLVHGPGVLTKNNTLWVFGGAGIFRKSIWDKLGGLDTLYGPFYWEDIDLSYRALKAGYKLIFEPKSIVTHNQQQGAIRNTYSQGKVKTIALRNQILFVWLNITDADLLFKHFLYLPYLTLSALIKLDTSFLRAVFSAKLKIFQVVDHRLRNRKMSIITDKEILQNLAE